MSNKNGMTRKYLELVSGFGLFVLFPGFFFYHLAVAAQAISPVAAGLFGPATVLLMGLSSLLILSVLSDSFRHSKIISAGFYLLLFYCLIWSLSYYSFGVGLQKSIEVIKQVATMLFAWFALYAIGLYLPLYNRKFKQIITASFVVILLIVLAYFDRNSMMMNVRDIYRTGDSVATYQGFARSALIVAILFACAIRSHVKMVIAMFVGIVILFLLGARSELYGFVALTVTLISFKSLRLQPSVIAALLLLLVAIYVLVDQFPKLAPSRQMQVFNLDKSSSWMGRQWLQSKALEQIADNPFMGRYAGHFEVGGAGAYSHNILSAWVSFGFVGFMLYGWLLVYGYAVSMRSFIKTKQECLHWRLAFSFNFISLLLLLVAKPIFWAIPALGWGLIVNARRQDSERSVSLP